MVKYYNTKILERAVMVLIFLYVKTKWYSRPCLSIQFIINYHNGTFGNKGLKSER